MHLVYLDESGNTGTNLADANQQIFVLAALVVPEECWQSLESDLEQAIRVHMPTVPVDACEIHASDLRAARGCFKNQSVADRVALRDAWMKIAHQHELKIIYRAIDKRRFQTWVHHKFGSGVLINPHVAAFALVARVVDEYLGTLGSTVRGMFISDENKEVAHDVEKSIRVLRSVQGELRLSRIIEKGFFIDSSKSRPLQLCDLCAFAARKLEEAAIEMPIKPMDAVAVELVKPLIHRGNENFPDVSAWLISLNPLQ